MDKGLEFFTKISESIKCNLTSTDIKHINVLFSMSQALLNAFNNGEITIKNGYKLVTCNAYKFKKDCIVDFEKWNPELPNEFVLNVTGTFIFEIKCAKDDGSVIPFGAEVSVDKILIKVVKTNNHKEVSSYSCKLEDGAKFKTKEIFLIPR